MERETSPISVRLVAHPVCRGGRGWRGRPIKDSSTSRRRPTGGHEVVRLLLFLGRIEIEGLGSPKICFLLLFHKYTDCSCSPAPVPTRALIDGSLYTVL